ncbi:hypothetical protein AMTR_s00013p00230800 [Amborella trichopoda]|uniref:Uncharacterized protein n=1 Tax=Amborella trichopoda TaxID=13333 RepID=W1PPK8_AMBTC|nr:hypothetical protein AMTR_s00013p00230800 [Amborella trichopoda]
MNDKPFLSEVSEPYCPILPGLPDDVAKYCLALVPRSDFPIVGSVWKASHWEVLGSLDGEHHLLPPMPGLSKSAFGVVVLDGKLLVIAGYVTEGSGTKGVSSEVYQYDSRLNRWSALANLNIARYDFACAEVGGAVYVVGGYDEDGESLSSAEVYDPDHNSWTLIESLRRPRWGCFACALNGKLYVMGGRSSFTIGNSKFVDIYDPDEHSWQEMKNGCVMVIAHAVLGQRLYCMEWKNQRRITIFDAEEGLWRVAPVPLMGSECIGFRFGILGGKLLLFSCENEPGYRTLVYDPDAGAGGEWQTTELRPSGTCLWSVTICA